MNLLHTFKTPALVAFLSTCAFVQSQAGILFNENFETPALASNSTQDLWDQNGRVGESGVLTAWGLGEFNYFSRPTLDPRTQLVNNSAAAYAGSQYLAFNMGQWDAGGTVFQSFTSAASTTYTLSYAVGAGASGGQDVTLRARAYDGSTVLGETTTTRSALGWQQASMSFTTGGSSGSIMIEFMDITSDATGNNTDLLLDSVSLTAVPEPSSYAAVFGLGLVGLGIARRRGNRAVVMA